MTVKSKRVEAERKAETKRMAVKFKRVEAERYVSMRVTQTNKITGKQPKGQLKRELKEKEPQKE